MVLVVLFLLLSPTHAPLATLHSVTIIPFTSSIHPADPFAASPQEVSHTSPRKQSQVCQKEQDDGDGRGIEGFLKISYCYGCEPPASI